MLRSRAVTDRQVLIEEIYAELEGLLVKKRGSSDEEEEDGQTIGFPEGAEAGSVDSESLAPAQQQSKLNSLADLLAELEKTQKLLRRGLTKLDRLMVSNA
jgi:hypothetical protein